MRNLTREQAITEHRKMWNWIANKIAKKQKVVKIKKIKAKYFKKFYDEPITYNCFLCEYNFQNKEEFCGNYCILKWGNNKSCMYNEFNEIINSCKWEEQHTLALQIANLEERNMKKPWKISRE